LSRKAVVRLVAGLGNRLFQLAAALEMVDGDLNRVQVHSKLGEKALRREPVKMRELEYLLNHRFAVASPFAQWLNRSLDERSRLGKPSSADGRRTNPSAASRSEQGRILKLGGTSYLRGFFQDPLWFPRHGEALIQQIIAARSPEVLALIPSEPYDCVHVRAGDYRAMGWLLDDDYLRRAIELGGFRPEDKTVYVIGEEEVATGAAQQLLASYGFPAVALPQREDPVVSMAVDFWTLALADRIVMSNSTFCWWAVRVGMSASKKSAVVYPRGWTAGDPAMTLSRALCLDTWTPVDSSCVPAASQ
jgi:hypothetical protein